MNWKKIFIILIFVILISFVSLVSAKEVFLNVGDSITFDNKKVALTNVGSGGAIVVSVGGVTETIQGAKDVNGVEIVIVETYYEDYKDQRSARINVAKSGEVCYEDNFCDYKEIDPWNKGTYHYRRKNIEIIDIDSSSLDLKINGIETTIFSPLWGGTQDPLKTVKVVDGIGLRFNLMDDREALYLGENFDNCPSDCPLDEEDDSRIIKAFCRNKEQDDITKEKEVDCDGFCERRCDQECLVTDDCEDKCNDMGDDIAIIRTCYCEKNECIDITYCEQDEDCVQVRNDLCGCEFVSVNKEHSEYWNDIYGKLFSAKSCMNPCEIVEYEPFCDDNMCNLKEKIIEKIILKEKIDDKEYEEDTLINTYEPTEEQNIDLKEETEELKDITPKEEKSTSFTERIFNWIFSLF